MVDRIVTVLGDIAPDALGTTLAHEHLQFDLRCLWEEPPAERAHLADAEPTLENLGELSRDGYHSRPNLYLDDPALAATELRRFKAAGGSAVVDMTTIGLAPNPDALVEISRATGVHVVAGCGYYRAKCLPGEVLDKPVEAIADELERWVVEGMGGTDVRAGLLGELGPTRRSTRSRSASCAPRRACSARPARRSTCTRRSGRTSTCAFSTSWRRKGRISLAWR